LAISSALLTHLEVPTSNSLSNLPPPWMEGWSDRLRDLPVTLVQRMHAQIAAEQVRVLERVTSGPVEDHAIAGALGSILNEGDSSQEGLWLVFQLERFELRSRDNSSIFEAATTLLRRGAVPSAPLWTSVAEYVLSLLKE
jgi:hypothetical protein